MSVLDGYPLRLPVERRGRPRDLRRLRDTERYAPPWMHLECTLLLLILLDWLSGWRCPVWRIMADARFELFVNNVLILHDHDHALIMIHRKSSC